jgi:hypothetical protein
MRLPKESKPTFMVVMMLCSRSSWVFLASESQIMSMASKLAVATYSPLGAVTFAIHVIADECPELLFASKFSSPDLIVWTICLDVASQILMVQSTDPDHMRFPISG